MAIENSSIEITRADYQKLEAELTLLKKGLQEITSGYKDVQTDIFDLDAKHEASDIIRKELYYKEQIASLEAKLRSVTIIESYENGETVGIGDIILVSTYSDPSKVEDYKIKLVIAPEMPRLDVIPVSVNSPLGKAVSGSMVNDVVTYAVDSTIMTAVIKEKLNLNFDGNSIDIGIGR